MEIIEELVLRKEQSQKSTMTGKEQDTKEQYSEKDNIRRGRGKWSITQQQKRISREKKGLTDSSIKVEQ